MRSLCGAGQVATVLHEATDPGSNGRFHVVGVGLWDLQDDEQLLNMLHPTNNIGRTLFRLSQSSGPEPVSAEVFNLLKRDWRTNKPDLVTPNLDVSTNRVIRIYTRTGDYVQLIHRIDWELELSETDIRCLNKAINARLQDNLKHIHDKYSGIGHIVIKDLGRRVVTRSLIRKLNTTFPDAEWYVSSKTPNPDWFKVLPAKNVRLLLVPQVAVATSERPTSPWIVAGSHPSLDAIEKIDELTQQYRKAHIVVLPGGMSLVTRGVGTGGKGDRVMVQSLVGSQDAQQFVPMASVFFPSLVASRISSKNAADGFLAQVKESLHFTDCWMGHEGGRLKSEDWKPSRTQCFTIADASRKMGGGESPFGQWHESEWDAERRMWTDALKDCGIVNTGGNAEFHLWRAMTEVPGYVSCVASKKANLRTLLKQGQGFVERRPRRSRSFMLIDAPGSGKSFLIKRLAKALRMRPLTFNITQMLTRQDLLHCFDTIATSQAQDPDEPILVFIDEINAKLDGQHVYDSFLAPLEDGVYVRSGNTFHIAPCLWVFAGTEKPVPRSEGMSHDKADKGSDFESRLSLPPMVLIAQNADENELRMEKIYVGVASIRGEWRDVRYVSEKVLGAFRTLQPGTGPRDIHQFVKHFKDIQFARVNSKNIPDEWEKLFTDELAIDGELLRHWKESPEGEYAEIKSEAGN